MTEAHAAQSMFLTVAARSDTGEMPAAPADAAAPMHLPIGSAEAVTGTTPLESRQGEEREKKSEKRARQAAKRTPEQVKADHIKKVSALYATFLRNATNLYVRIPTDTYAEVPKMFKKPAVGTRFAPNHVYKLENLDEGLNEHLVSKRLIQLTA